MKFYNKKLFFALLLVLYIFCLPFQAIANELYVLGLTDFHGQIQPSPKASGLPKLMGAIKDFTAKHPNTILVGVGDLFMGSVESNLSQGEPVLAAFKDLGLSISALGNHEFDWGQEPLKRWKKSGLNLLAANIKTTEHGQPNFCEPYIIIEKNGLRVAFVGLITPHTAHMTAPENILGLKFTSPQKSLQQLLPILKDKADVIIVLAHLSDQTNNFETISPDIIELAKLSQVTAIIYGHSHQEHLGKIEQVPVIQPAHWGNSLAVLKISKDNEKVTAQAELIPLSQKKLSQDSVGQNILDSAIEKTKQQLAQPIAILPKAYVHDDKKPSPLGELVCAAIQKATGADVAMINGGSIRNNLPAGQIYMRELYQVLPFENNLVLLDISGKKLRRVLEHALSDSARRHIQLSGIYVDYDSSKPSGKRVHSMKFKDGKTISPKDRLKLGISSFLASGGNKFSFNGIKKLKKFYFSEREALQNFLLNQPELNFTGWLNKVNN